MTSTTDAEVAARYGVTVDEEAEGIAEPWNTDGGNIRWIASLSEWVGKAASWLTLPLLVVLGGSALWRSLGFGKSFVWAQDIGYTIYASHFLLGAAYTLKKSGHIRTDFEYRKWSVKKQAGIDAFIYAFLFIPVMVVALWVSTGWAWDSFQIREQVITSAWDGPLWTLKAMLPIGLFLWTLQSISELVKSVRAYRKGEWEEPLA